MTQHVLLLENGFYFGISADFFVELAIGFYYRFFNPNVASETNIVLIIDKHYMSVL